jgi:transcription antitermination protein NusB
MAVSGRRGARRLLVQALYQHQLSAHGLAELESQFCSGSDFKRIDGDYFRQVLSEILRDPRRLDTLIATDLDRPPEQLDPVEHGILWMGTAELLAHPDVPVKVIINEAVQLAKDFGAQDSYRYINAVLDCLAARLR